MIHTSVIIPVYNSAAYLDDCLRSVLRQDDGGIEILLVDDGSADESPAILRRWAAADSRVRVLRQEHGMQGRARNLGIAKQGATTSAFWIPTICSRRTRSRAAMRPPYRPAATS